MIFKTTLRFYQMKPEEFTDDMAARVLNLFPSQAQYLGQWREKGRDTYFTIEEIMHIDDVMELGIPMDYIDLKPIPRITMPREKFLALKSEDPEVRRTAGDTFQIKMPGFDLLTIREVTWRENCCTEEINDMLGEGWVMLAILPQPNHRRPDYILGRNSRQS